MQHSACSSKQTSPVITVLDAQQSCRNDAFYSHHVSVNVKVISGMSGSNAAGGPDSGAGEGHDRFDGGQDAAVEAGKEDLL